MAKRIYLVIRSNEGSKICDAEWKRLLSRVDFVLARHHPDFNAELTHPGAKLEDRKCPRQNPFVEAKDMI